MTVCASLWENARQCMLVEKQRTRLVLYRYRTRKSLSVKGGVLVICHRIRYPDKAIREKQILQPYRFNSLVPHSDELLKNEARLKLVLYEGLQICLLSGLLPPVFIGCKGLLINLSLLLSGQRGQSEQQVVCSSQHRCVNPYSKQAHG